MSDQVEEIPQEIPYPGFKISNSPIDAEDVYMVTLTVQDGDIPLSEDDPSRHELICYVAGAGPDNAMTAQCYASEIAGALGMNIVNHTVEPV